MPNVVLLSVVAHGTQVVVATLGALPPNAEDGRLSAKVAHGPFVFDASWSAVDDAKIIGAHTAIVGCRSIVPNDDNFFSRLKVSHRSQMPFSAILKRMSFVDQIKNSPRAVRRTCFPHFQSFEFLITLAPTPPSGILLRTTALGIWRTLDSVW